MNWCVVHEVPDESSDETVLGFISDRSLDDLFLHCCSTGPSHHVSGVLLPVGTRHKASIIRTKRSGEHSCAPWPVHVVQLDGLAAAIDFAVVEGHLLDSLQIAACNHCLLLTRIRNLWHWWNGPLAWLLAWLFHAGVVAVTDGK